jgi:hypothetical protein
MILANHAPAYAEIDKFIEPMILDSLGALKELLRYF